MSLSCNVDRSCMRLTVQFSFCFNLILILKNNKIEFMFRIASVRTTKKGFLFISILLYVLDSNNYY